LIEPQQAPPDDVDAPNIAAIAFFGFMAGLILWLGGACLVLGSGGQGLPNPAIQQQQQQNVSTPKAATASPTRLADRTNCAEIRGTDYRSEAERRWFLANCG
jgi:hypothetical protein